MKHLKTALLGSAAAAIVASSALAQTRVVNYYADFDPAPLAAFEAVIADFEAANPDIDIVLQNFEPNEGYKTIESATSCSAEIPRTLMPTWYAGNRMPHFVNSAQIPGHLRRLDRQQSGVDAGSAKGSMNH